MHKRWIVQIASNIVYEIVIWIALQTPVKGKKNIKSKLLKENFIYNNKYYYY